jgi:dihydrofolate synthase/folylpolyglutamate synthase
MAILGDTLAQIAAEKAGIIKPGATVVVAPQQAEARSVILSVCRERDAFPILVGTDVTWAGGPADMDGQAFRVQGRLGAYDLRIPLLGTYQLENAASAVAALEVLHRQGHTIPAQAMAEGFARVSWPCRLEVLSRDPLIVADGAHNGHSIGALLESLPRYLSYRRLVLIVGFSRDKDIPAMIKPLAEHNPLVFATRSRHPRSLPPASLAAEFHARGVPAIEVDTVAEALARARSQARPGDLILGTGSLFVAAEVRESVLGIEPELYPDLLPPDSRAQQPTV